MRARLLLALCALGLLVPGSASARRVQEHAAAAGVSATLSYTVRPERYGVHFSRPFLTIRRHGVVKVARYLRSFRGDTGAYPPQPGDYFAHHRSIAVRNLDTDAAPEVLVDLYTGGAHCCYHVEVFDSRSSGRTYASVTEDFLDAGATLRNPDHRGPPEWVSADARLAYAFGSFASAGFPLRIVRFVHGRFRAVTREFPGLVRKDAREYFALRDKARRQGDARGVLAAYVADEAILGNAPAALRRVTAIADAGRLGRYAQPGGRAFVRALRKTLRGLGYRLG